MLCTSQKVEDWKLYGSSLWNFDRPHYEDVAVNYV